MKLGIDIDDVLASFIPEFRKISREMFGKPEDPECWPCDWMWSNFGLTDEQRAAVWAAIAKKENFHATLQPCPATDMLGELDGENELYFITARRPSRGFTPKEQTEWWLKHHFHIYNPTVLVSADKAPLIRALELDAFIDDRAETCEAIAKETNCKPYLLDAPHNKHCDPTIERVTTFNEFAKLFL